MNIVLDNTVEIVSPTEKNEIGMVVIRGHRRQMARRLWGCLSTDQLPQDMMLVEEIPHHPYFWEPIRDVCCSAKGIVKLLPPLQIHQHEGCWNPSVHAIGTSQIRIVMDSTSSFIHFVEATALWCGSAWTESSEWYWGGRGSLASEKGNEWPKTRRGSEELCVPLFRGDEFRPKTDWNGMKWMCWGICHPMKSNNIDFMGSSWVQLLELTVLKSWRNSSGWTNLEGQQVWSERSEFGSVANECTHFWGELQRTHPTSPQNLWSRKNPAKNDLAFHFLWIFGGWWNMK